MAERVERKKSKKKSGKFLSSNFQRKKGSKHESKVETKKWKVEKNEIDQLVERYNQIKSSEIESFGDFPLSEKTMKGLQQAGYGVPTEIQRVAIGLALQGHDVLGAAKTGSGKTLAFLIPILECLYRNSWSAVDGLGAVVISPTRELAYQTFEVICKIGMMHDFSAGLVIGGKDLKTEMERIPRTNIVVCTPGRLLQHMDETACFESHNLQMLVLDEADRILDLGFQKTIDAILEHLPTERQTLLFSATQTKSVRDLARLSLKDPKYVSVHEHHDHSTPVQLDQSYIVCELDQKLDVLYSFLKAHLKQKILVFMASCKQVKYIFEVFCMLNPGITVMALYGAMHQMRRVAVYEEFCVRESAVLLATDIAARGLDFPAVNWVVQLDCPEDSSTYIHRVGRTARYEKDGEALLILLPSEEEAMAAQMEKRKIPIQKIQVNPNKKLTIEKKIQSFCAQNIELKKTAQRAFISYLKSVYLMKSKEVFDVRKLPLQKFAGSLGLAVAPRVRFIQRAEKRKREQSKKPTVTERTSKHGTHPVKLSVHAPSGDGEISKGSDFQNDESEGYESRAEKDGEEESDDRDSSDAESDSSSVHQAMSREDAEAYGFHGDDDDGDLLIMKEKDVFQKMSGSASDDEDVVVPVRNSKKSNRPLTKYALAKKINKKNLVVNTKKVFDEEGEIQAQWPPAQQTTSSRLEEADGDDEGGIDIETAKRFMEEEDKHDKQLFIDRIKAKHKAKRVKTKRKTKKGNEESDDEDEGLTLGTSLNVEEDDRGFDPSSLPDPDVHSAFVDKGDEDGEEEDVGDVPAGDDEMKHKKPSQLSKPSKRKSEDTRVRKKKKKPDFRFEEDASLDTGMTLEEDEQLALHMLSAGRF